MNLRDNDFLPRLVLLVGLASMVLVPSFVYLSARSLDVQERHVSEMLQERGEALVHSLEAAAHSSLALRSDVRGREFFLQKLVWETAQATDIDYIIVTNKRGSIVADSDPVHIGAYYGLDLPEAQRVSSTKGARRVANLQDADTYEVFGLFTPFGDGDEELVIFVGLNTERYEEARAMDRQMTIKRNTITFLIGILALLLLGTAVSFYSTRRSLRRLRILSEGVAANIPVGLLVIDENLQIRASNELGKRFLGSLAVPGNNEEQAAWVIENTIAGLPNTGDAPRKHCYSADGITVWEITAARYRDRHLGGYIILLSDISATKNLEKQLARSQRLATLGNLATGLAHEIRNPLSSIKGFATFLSEKYQEETGETRKIVRMMGEEIERLNRVVNEVLDFARLGNIKKVPCDIGAIARSVGELLAERAENKGVKILCESPSDLPMLYADADKIKQAFLNLALNGVEACLAGGVVTISIEANPNSVRVEFGDTGSGVAEAARQKLFEPYYTTKVGGSGLGLAISKGIIEAHDGEIIVGYSPSGGARFVVVLPLDFNCPSTEREEET